MLHKAWSSIEEMPYCFWRSSIEFQGHTAKKIVDCDQNWAFPDCNFSLNSLKAVIWCRRLEHRRGALLFSKVIPQISSSHRTQNSRFWPELSISWLWLQFQFTDGFEMMHKAWCSIEEAPYCFPRSSIKFQGHKGQKIADFDPNWAFPECNFSLNSLMDLKWYTKLDVV